MRGWHVAPIWAVDEAETSAEDAGMKVLPVMKMRL
jgi:hypothetical protein